MFNRYLSRIRANHPVFGDKELLIIILEYLEGEDLYKVSQVCFSFRSAVQSVPYLEITLLKFTVQKSNEVIEKLKGVDEKKDRVLFHRKNWSSSFIFAKNSKLGRNVNKVQDEVRSESKGNEPDFNEEKWIKFTKHFHDYARNNGLKILKREDFDDHQQWRDYKLKYILYYHNYVDHLKQERMKADKLKMMKRKLFNNYRSFVEHIGFGFHEATGFRFVKPKPNPYLPPKPPSEE